MGSNLLRQAGLQADGVVHYAYQFAHEYDREYGSAGYGRSFLPEDEFRRILIDKAKNSIPNCTSDDALAVAIATEKILATMGITWQKKTASDADPQEGELTRESAEEMRQKAGELRDKAGRIRSGPKKISLIEEADRLSAAADAGEEAYMTRILGRPWNRWASKTAVAQEFVEMNKEISALDPQRDIGERATGEQSPVNSMADEGLDEPDKNYHHPFGMGMGTEPESVRYGSKTAVSEDTLYTHIEGQDEVAISLLDEYKSHINDANYRQHWEVIPAARLKKIWSDYAKLGFVRDERGIDRMASLVVENIHKIEVNNILTGHTSESSLDYAEQILGEKLPEDFLERGEAFFDDDRGQLRISDYAADQLSSAALRLQEAKSAEEKLQIIDHILNIVHQRSDIASWFVQGGSATLGQLSGTMDKAEKAMQSESKSAAKTKAVEPFKDQWQPGETAWFEYHCWESDDSCDAKLWHHSHQKVTVLREDLSADGSSKNLPNTTPEQRFEEAVLKAYEIKFKDGFVATAMEDELYTDPQGFERPDPPKAKRSSAVTFKTRGLLEGDMPSSADQVFEMLLDGHKIGAIEYMVLDAAPHKTVQIVGSHILPEYRGKGFGKQLYTAFFQEAHRQGYEYVISDETLSPEAKNVWESLAKSGLASPEDEGYIAKVAKFVVADDDEEPYPDTGTYDENDEARRREVANIQANYAEEGVLFDPKGNYLCNGCSQFDSAGACGTVSGKISGDTGSCGYWEIKGQPLVQLESKFTQKEAGYTERPHEKGFGCKRCVYGADAKKADTEGRGMWCAYWGTHVRDNACCAKNEGADDVFAPGEKGKKEAAFASPLLAAIPPATMYHYTDAANRSSILKHGLLGSEARAIENGVFLDSKLTAKDSEGKYTDAWAVDVRGLDVEPDWTTDIADNPEYEGHTWWVFYGDIPPSRLRLVRKGITETDVHQGAAPPVKLPDGSGFFTATIPGPDDEAMGKEAVAGGIHGDEALNFYKPTQTLPPRYDQRRHVDKSLIDNPVKDDREAEKKKLEGPTPATDRVPLREELAGRHVMGADELALAPRHPDEIVKLMDFKEIFNFLKDDMGWHGANPFYPDEYPWLEVRVYDDQWVMKNVTMGEEVASGTTLGALKTAIGAVAKEYRLDPKKMVHYNRRDIEMPGLTHKGSKTASEQGEYWLNLVEEREAHAKELFAQSPEVRQIAQDNGWTMEQAWEEMGRNFANELYDPRTNLVAKKATHANRPNPEAYNELENVRANLNYLLTGEHFRNLSKGLQTRLQGIYDALETLSHEWDTVAGVPPEASLYEEPMREGQQLPN